ncbi:MAG: hypothetical protein JSW73_03690 [Candidatus Woesearchaeota archaeon]|nr:MAG: hypothetical protein JSW73_03690 [Candidatus Woesearchaeota archaeon]
MGKSKPKGSLEKTVDKLVGDIKKFGGPSELVEGIKDLLSGKIKKPEGPCIVCGNKDAKYDRDLGGPYCPTHLEDARMNALLDSCSYNKNSKKR